MGALQAIRAARRGQALIELSLSLPLLLLIFFGGLVAGLGVDDKVLGAGAVAAGARVGGELGDGNTNQPSPLTQDAVDFSIATSVAAQASQMPHAHSFELYIFPGASGAFNRGLHFDHWSLVGSPLRPVRDPSQQTYALAERAPAPPGGTPNYVGVYLAWTYDPPAAGYASKINMDDLSVHPVPQPPPAPPGAPGHAIPRSVSMRGGVTGHFYNMIPNKAPAQEGLFDDPADPRVTEYWTQSFSQVDFDPPAEANLGGCPQNITAQTRPFTNLNPSNCSTVVAQGMHGGRLWQAGQFAPGSTDSRPFPVTFEAAFTGTLHVTQHGFYDLHIYSDDGFILGMGGGASYYDGADSPRIFHNPPPRGTTYLNALPILDCWNDGSSPAQRTFRVSFPTDNVDYPFEIDYSEIRDADLTLVFGSSLGDPIPAGN
jgi:hypothetical protein